MTLKQLVDELSDYYNRQQVENGFEPELIFDLDGKKMQLLSMIPVYSENKLIISFEEV